MSYIHQIWFSSFKLNPLSWTLSMRDQLHLPMAQVTPKSFYRKQSSAGRDTPPTWFGRQVDVRANSSPIPEKRVSCSSFNDHILQFVHFICAAQKFLSCWEPSLHTGVVFASLQSFTKVTGFTLKFCIIASDLPTSSLLPAPPALKSQVSTRKLQAISASNLLSVFCQGVLMKRSHVAFQILCHL